MIAMFDLVYERAFPNSAWEREKRLYFYNHSKLLRIAGIKSQINQLRMGSG
jgi:hypothetical protein